MKNFTPLQAIRAHCRWCRMDRAFEVGMRQPQEGCLLWCFRLGRTRRHALPPCYRTAAWKTLTISRYEQGPTIGEYRKTYL